MVFSPYLYFYIFHRGPGHVSCIVYLLVYRGQHRAKGGCEKIQPGPWAVIGIRNLGGYFDSFNSCWNHSDRDFYYFCIQSKNNTTLPAAKQFYK